ncbi:metallophosphoesterase [Bradyrhizobium sp. CCBAU 051011]|uniref:metallophosphoesterase family protein n=1 Tax=Bradyrhizobium sp. CCBAU 051011 TaxID=858422 RepID=UPI0013744955|nr:metallophosphoesterase [Bradyrhizobium sp. CCBAU 051011]QHO78167.1 metallophosphoesterase [Bradyrhizobium sp. CCBAU 051011]
MTDPAVERDSASMEDRMLVDPRHGDIEDDAASPGQRSLLAIAGSLLVEISLPKLLFAWTVLLLLPAVLLGLAPLLVSAWLATLSEKLAALTGIGTALALLAIVAVGWIGWRPLLRIAENNFWSLNALAVQPGYAFTREALRHLTERMWGRKLTVVGRARLRSANSIGAAVLLSAGAVLIAMLAWPASRWTGGWNDLVLLHRLTVPTLANAILLVSGYLAVASLMWGFADASMQQPVDLATFDTASSDARRWRVAHLSDLHVIGEQYGFRIESGRAGPRGNDRLERVLAHLAAIHAAGPLDHILVTGDMTDAGRASEWAAFLDAMARHPELAARTILLPGNHDLNIVDRANPARLDLPFSPNKRLRQIRTLSAMAAVQGDRVHIVDGNGKMAVTLSASLAPKRDSIVALAQHGGLRRAAALRGLFDDQFPMILPPDAEGGLGIAVLNSNAETHFSFTNALGLVSVEQTHRLEAAIRHYPAARWIFALHHHVVEYPMPVKAFSERIGTALINGSWFVRKLDALAGRTVVMHGHRHIDWIGACGSLKIISAPSPVMNATDDAATHFYIHTLAAGPEGRLDLLPPQRVEIAGEKNA